MQGKNFFKKKHTTHYNRSEKFGTSIPTFVSKCVDRNGYTYLKFLINENISSIVSADNIP